MTDENLIRDNYSVNVLQVLHALQKLSIDEKEKDDETLQDLQTLGNANRL